MRLFLSTAVAVVGFSTAAFAQGPTTRADFNGDGFDDLAIGVPGQNSGAGGVNVIYGPATGLTPIGDRFFGQSSAGVSGAEPNDNCGAALTVGDFDADGFFDLAVGCPGETVGGDPSAGGVFVIYGRASGLSDIDSQFFSQSTGAVPGGAEPNDRCGSALASGDFDGDGRADLAWGCPGEALSAGAGVGAVNVLYGSPTGLTTAGSQFLSQATAGVPDIIEAGDHCGQALAAADFNGDGRADLAMGCPGEDLTIAFIFSEDAGAVNVFYGSASGLTGSGSVLVDQRGLVFDGVEAGDQCGSALAVGDFDRDGRADLAMGCPGEDLLRDLLFVEHDAGAVYIRFGTATGFTGDLLIAPIPRGSARCGAAVAAGDFNGNGHADIAWGCPGLLNGAGVIDVIHGTPTREFVFLKTFSQNSPGILDDSEPLDAFGAALASADFNGDGFADLAIGVPGEDFGSTTNAGAVNVIYGSVAGLTDVGNQFFTQDTPGIADVAANFEQFGFALAGSGGTAAPGLTGTWADLTQTCHGKDDDACVLRGTFTASNPSTQSTPKVMLRFFLSSDATLDSGDLLLDEVRVKPLAIGETQPRKLHVRLPRGVDATGQFVIAFIDAENVVVEANEANNVVVFGPIQ